MQARTTDDGAKVPLFRPRPQSPPRVSTSLTGGNEKILEGGQFPTVRDLFICAKDLFVAARKGFASFTGNGRSHAHAPPSATRTRR
jgi:hypothetical protein